MKIASRLTAAMLLALVPGLASAQDLTKLRSPLWAERAKVVVQIKKLAAAKRTPEMERALLEVMKLENQVIADSYRAGDGVSLRYGEGYSEYYFGDLMPLVETFALRNPDAATVAILVDASYNPDSPYAKRLATLGEKAVSALTTLAKRDLAPWRWSALAVMGEILSLRGQQRLVLSTESARTFKRALHHAAQGDTDAVARRWAVQALLVGGDREDLGVLMNLANDPDGSSSVSKGDRERSVRSLAAKAIAAIQARGR